MNTIKFVSPTIREIIEIIKGGVRRDDGFDDDVSWVGVFEGVREGVKVSVGDGLRDGSGEGVDVSVGDGLGGVFCT